MAFKLTRALGVKPAAIPETIVLPESKETVAVVEQTIRLNEANLAATNELLNQRDEPDYLDRPLPDPEAIDSSGESRSKLSRLVDDDFPFDESQLAAINGIANQRYACLTGAAGTGKTTSTKAIVDRIQDSIGEVDMTNYWGKKSDSADDEVGSPIPGDDDYEMPESAIPAICLVGFTGRSTQMIKKNFPRDWHGNIMTIHRMLGFVPEFYMDWDDATNAMRNKMRFVPTYTADFKLPWDVIVIDEAGMVSIDLWNMVWAAAKPGCRIIMIGDINQLPPVHGRSIFGFAMTKWPSWELTHIHRQVGVNNSIVDNAWRVLKGIRPISDDYKTDPSWKFAMMAVPEDSMKASMMIRKWLEKMNGKAYMPHRDSVITAINAENHGSGYALGQIPMNRELAIVFNAESPRYIIDAGRSHKQFAVGDKVMATRNDHEIGITNGMTGKIIEIAENGAYAGDRTRFGKADEIAAMMREEAIEEDTEFSLEDMEETYALIDSGKKNAKEKKERGPASHIVTVEFGDEGHTFTVPFATLAEVQSLMIAYVVTCHKMQGGESPLVVIILHQAHKSMLNREWLYTAITRASRKCVVFYTDMGLRSALSKQRITGSTLQKKVEMFQALQTEGLVGAAVKVNLPDPEVIDDTVESVGALTILEQQPVKDTNRVNPLLKMIMESKAEAPAPRKIQIDVDVVVTHRHETVPPTPVQPARKPTIIPRVIDNAHPDFKAKELAAIQAAFDRKPALLNRSVIPVSPVRTIEQAARPKPLALTHQPQETPAKPQSALRVGKFNFVTRIV